MFQDISWFLSVLGLCFVIFSIAKILHSIAMFLEDNEKSDLLVRIVAFISYFLYLCVLPLTGFIYLLFHYANSRSNKIAYEDGLRSSKSLDKIQKPTLSVSENCSCTLTPRQKPKRILKTFLFALVVFALCVSHYFAYCIGHTASSQSQAEDHTLSIRDPDVAPTPTSSVTPIGGNYKPYGSLYNYIVSNRVWITSYGTHYHKEDCFHLSSHDCEPCLLDNAKSRGYSPCSCFYD